MNFSIGKITVNTNIRGTIETVPSPCPLSLVPGQRSMINDHWSMIIDHWSLINDQWSVFRDHWSLTNDHWSVIIYHWLLIVDHWSLIIDQWSFIIDQWSFLINHLPFSLIISKIFLIGGTRWCWGVWGACSSYEGWFHCKALLSFYFEHLLETYRA